MLSDQGKKYIAVHCCSWCMNVEVISLETVISKLPFVEEESFPAPCCGPCTWEYSGGISSRHVLSLLSVAGNHCLKDALGKKRHAMNYSFTLPSS